MRGLRFEAAVLAAVWALGLSACSDKRDTTAAAKKLDDSPVAGAQQAGYTASGWKVGDATSWEEHMRTRAQGQNEYTKTR